jgi:hypothetical protein
LRFRPRSFARFIGRARERDAELRLRHAEELARERARVPCPRAPRAARTATRRAVPANAGSTGTRPGTRRTRTPAAHPSRSASGIAPRSSIVRYETHRVASSTRGAGERLRRARVQAPRAAPAAVRRERRVGRRASADEQRAEEEERSEPRVEQHVFLPNQPSPARRARSRSSRRPGVDVRPAPRRRARATPAADGARRSAGRAPRRGSRRRARSAPPALPGSRPAVVHRHDQRAHRARRLARRRRRRGARRGRAAPAAACRAACRRRSPATPSRRGRPSATHAANASAVSTGPSRAIPRGRTPRRTPPP